MTVDVPALRTQFRADKAELLQRFKDSRPTTSSATRLLTQLSRLVDRVLQTLWEAHAMPKGAALVAVGGYGRGELFPHSDIDVLLLMPLSPSVAGDDSLAPSVEGFISACWDIGLEIGSSVRTIDECVDLSRRDVTVQTALLEARFLCGSRRVYTAFRRACDAVMDPKAFLREYEAHVNHLVYEAVAQFGGSFSAEHGIGLHKKPFLGLSRSPAELAAMRQIKQALDPLGLMNPGKIF